MKKLPLLLLSLTLLLTLTACGGEAPETPVTDTQKPLSSLLSQNQEEGPSLADSAAEAVCAFAASPEFAQMSDMYLTVMGQAPRPPQVLSALELDIPDLGGIPVHGLMVFLQADLTSGTSIYEDTTSYNEICLYLDLDSGAVYDFITHDPFLWSEENAHRILDENYILTLEPADAPYYLMGSYAIPSILEASQIPEDLRRDASLLSAGDIETINAALQSTLDAQQAEAAAAEAQWAPVRRQKILDAVRSLIDDPIFPQSLRQRQELEGWEAPSGYSVSHAMEFSITDPKESFNCSVLLVRVKADTLIEGGIFNGVSILIDLETGEVYNELLLGFDHQDAFTTPDPTPEDIAYALMLYYQSVANLGTGSLLQWGRALPLEESELALINQALFAP